MKRFLPIVAASLCLVSCHRIPLYDPSGNILLQLDLKLAAEVSVSADIDLDAHPEFRGKVEMPKPSDVRVCFYDTQTHRLVAEDFLPADGGFISVPGGTYDVLVYSLGDAATQVTGTEARGTAYAFTNPEGTKVKVGTKSGTDGEASSEYEVIYEPDHLLVGRMEQLVIPSVGTIDRTVVIESALESLLETYTFEIPAVIGAENIKDVDIYITGQASGRYLWDKRYPSRPCALHLPAVVDRQQGTLYTVFNTFGKFPGLESEVFLHVQVTGEHGGLYQWTFDVTDPFNNPDNTGHKIVIEQPLEVPDDPEGSGGGFDPTVTDWNVEIIHIELS